MISDRQTGNPIAVLDTKYKSTEQPTESDIQQVTAYALEMGVSKAFLIYPSEIAAKVSAKIGHVRVESIVFDTSVTVQEGGQRFLELLLPGLPQQ